MSTPFRTGYLLEPIKRMEITISETRDPEAFFKTRTGLYVYEDFRAKVLANAKPIPAGSRFLLDASMIGGEERMANMQIKASLPRQHLFDESATCAIIAEIVSNQPQGQEGTITVRQLVLMYLASCAAHFYWLPGNKEWGVDAWLGHHRGWNPGSWVLAPGN